MEPPAPTVPGRLSDDDRAAIRNALETIRSRLPFLRTLSPEDRANLMRLGKPGRAFVRQALDLALKDPGILPRSFDEEAFVANALLFGQLGETVDQLRDLLERVADTEALAGAEAFAAAMVVHQCGKWAPKPDVPAGS